MRLRDHLRKTKETDWRGKAIRLVEEGRRVHGSHLRHDLMLVIATKQPEQAFRAYWHDLTATVPSTAERGED